MNIKQYKTEWYEKNKIHVQEYKKEWAKKNKEKLKKYRKKYYMIHKEKIKARTRTYTKNNRKYVLENKKEYYKNNREKLLDYQILYRKKYHKKFLKYRRMHNRLKRKNSLQFRLYQNLGTRIRIGLKNTILGKTKRTTSYTKEILGCSYNKLIRHIEKQFKPGMTWNNYGLYGWHIDHIKPCCSFILENENERKKCFNYKNLQPLWAKENIKKGGTYYG